MCVCMYVRVCVYMYIQYMFAYRFCGNTLAHCNCNTFSIVLADDIFRSQKIVVNTAEDSLWLQAPGLEGLVMVGVVKHLVHETLGA